MPAAPVAPTSRSHFSLGMVDPSAGRRRKGRLAIGLAGAPFLGLLLWTVLPPPLHTVAARTDASAGRSERSVGEQARTRAAPANASEAAPAREEGAGVPSALALRVDLTRTAWQYNTIHVLPPSREGLWRDEDDETLASCAVDLEASLQNDLEDAPPREWPQVRARLTTCGASCRQRCSLYEVLSVADDPDRPDQAPWAALVDAAAGPDKLARAVAGREIARRRLPDPAPPALVAWADDVSTAEDDVVMGYAVAVLLQSGRVDRADTLLDALEIRLARNCNEDPRCQAAQDQNLAEARAVSHRRGGRGGHDPLALLLASVRACAADTAPLTQNGQITLTCQNGSYTPTRAFPTAAGDIGRCLGRDRVPCVDGRDADLTLVTVRGG